VLDQNRRAQAVKAAWRSENVYLPQEGLAGNVRESKVDGDDLPECNATRLEGPDQAPGRAHGPLRHRGGVPSFPSGHLSTATTVWAALALLGRLSL